MGFTSTSGRLRADIVAAQEASGAVRADFRATIAEGVATIPVGQYFTSAESGRSRVYKRTAAAPGYQDQGDAAAPLTRADLTPRTVQGDTIALAGETIATDTAAASFLVTLPADGGRVTILDGTGSWGAHPLTIDGNGRLIDGKATFAADAARYSITFTAVGATWRYSLAYQYGA